MGCCGGSSVKNDKFSAFPDACYNGNIEKMTELLKKEGKNASLMINKQNAEGFAPIHRAAQKGSSEAIRFLLDNNADCRLLTKNGETPLHVACFHRNTAAVKELLKTAAKEDVNTQDRIHGMTPLHVAVYRGCPEITQLLIAQGGNPQLADNYGQGALEMAKFWCEQEAAGLSSPTAKHKETFNFMEQTVKVA